MRKGELIFNLSVTVFPLLICLLGLFGMSLIVYTPRIYILSMALFYIFGCASLLRSKIGKTQRKTFFSFGFNGMTKEERIFCVTGYIFIAFGFILNLGFIFSKT